MPIAYDRFITINFKIDDGDLANNEKIFHIFIVNHDSSADAMERMTRQNLFIESESSRKSMTKLNLTCINSNSIRWNSCSIYSCYFHSTPLFNGFAHAYDMLSKLCSTFALHRMQLCNSHVTICFDVVRSFDNIHMYRRVYETIYHYTTKYTMTTLNYNLSIELFYLNFVTKQVFVSLSFKTFMKKKKALIYLNRRTSMHWTWTHIRICENSMYAHLNVKEKIRFISVAYILFYCFS